MSNIKNIKQSESVEPIDLEGYTVNLPDGKYTFFSVPAEKAAVLGCNGNVICATDINDLKTDPSIVRFRDSERFELCYIEYFTIGDGRDSYEFLNLITEKKDEPIPVMEGEIFSRGAVYAVAPASDLKSGQLNFEILE